MQFPAVSRGFPRLNLVTSLYSVFIGSSCLFWFEVHIALVLPFNTPMKNYLETNNLEIGLVLQEQGGNIKYSSNLQQMIALQPRASSKKLNLSSSDNPCKRV